MRRSTLWLAPLALVLGLGAAVAFAESNPLTPKALGVFGTGCGSAMSKEGGAWTPLNDCGGLWLNCPTYVRGPANVIIQGGTILMLPPCSIAKVSWDPAVRGYRVDMVRGSASICFGNGAYPICQCQSVTLMGGESGWPMGFVPRKLPDTPEVSGFDPNDIPGIAD